MRLRKVSCGVVFCGFSILAASGSAFGEPKEDWEIALKSLGYNLNSYAFEESGWLTKEKHIFNGGLICFISSKKKIDSIEDNDVVIVKDGFYGQVALARRDELNAERRAAIEEARRKGELEKSPIDERLEETERKFTRHLMERSKKSN